MSTPGSPPAVRGTVLQRLRRFVPYFRGSGWALPCMVAATTLAALTEPVIPALMKPLLDDGFKGGAFSLWLVPAALLGLFALRGLAGFVAQYSLAYMANQAMVALRRRLFGTLQAAPMSLFGQSSASTLSNTVVYEVQTGTTLLVNAMLSLLNRPNELKGHIRGALNNGCSLDEIREVLLHATVYGGVPCGSDSFRIAREVFAQEKI